MTDCALAAPAPPAAPSVAPTATAPTATAPTAIGRLHGRRTRPSGIPRWAWLLGVTVVPLAQEDQHAPQAWVLSAGAGTAHVAALLHDQANDTERVSPGGSASWPR